MQTKKNDYELMTARKYVSCHELEEAAILFSDGITHCSEYASNKMKKWEKIKLDYNQYKNIDELMKRLVEQKKRIIQDNIEGKLTICTQCPKLHEGYWKTDKLIRQINLSLDSSCNLRCCYCYKRDQEHFVRKQRDIVELIKKIKKSSLTKIEYPILYSSGEIAIQPNLSAIIEEIEEYEVCIFSNGTIFDHELLKIIQKTGSFMLISIDSGTKETYRKIKGVDLFEQVYENIKKYIFCGGKIVLKYILLEENVGNDDLTGFIQMCKQLHIYNIRISSDFGQGNISSSVKNAFIKLAYMAQKNGINVYTHDVYEIYSAMGCVSAKDDFYERNKSF